MCLFLRFMVRVVFYFTLFIIMALYPNKPMGMFLGLNPKRHFLPIYFKAQKQEGFNRIYSVQVNDDGARLFAFAKESNFCTRYQLLHPCMRWWYEVIPENSPSRLYFDIDIKKKFFEKSDETK